MTPRPAGLWWAPGKWGIEIAPCPGRRWPRCGPGIAGTQCENRAVIWDSVPWHRTCLKNRVTFHYKIEKMLLLKFIYLYILMRPQIFFEISTIDLSYICSASQIYSEDFAKFCGLLRMYEFIYVYSLLKRKICQIASDKLLGKGKPIA